MPALAAVQLTGSPAPWARFGLTVGPDGTTIRVGSVECRFDVDSTSDPPGGILALGLADLDVAVDADGLSFVPAAAGDPAPASAHPCRASSIDHIVVMTSSLDRTCGAVEEAVGAPLKRVREVGRGVRQGFHRLGEAILEVVETPQVTASHAEFWGLVFVVDDLDRWAAGFGDDLVSPPKDAVQPGRRISNVRVAAGLPCPVAFMSPDPRIR